LTSPLDDSVLPLVVWPLCGYRVAFIVSLNTAALSHWTLASAETSRDSYRGQGNDERNTLQNLFAFAIRIRSELFIAWYVCTFVAYFIPLIITVTFAFFYITLQDCFVNNIQLLVVERKLIDRRLVERMRRRFGNGDLNVLRTSKCSVLLLTTEAVPFK
jgi:hypothetical protein